MAGRIPSQFIDTLLARIDIVEVIEQRVPLKKAGRDWQACCPFHDERTPSFTVSPAKQFYHCFGCGAHGSAIRFLMEYDRLEFVDAIEELARRTGLEVPYEGGRNERRDEGGEAYAVLESATGFFERGLADSAVARAYFDQRGVDPELRQRFRLGYAPDGWDGLRRAVGTSPERLAELLRQGLLIEGGRNGSYDRFRDRVMFPIMDRRGRPIAFGGRVLAAAEGPKYMNSPETPLFHKGRELFGLWQARQAHAKLPRLLVVEGYMDVIALHQHGLTEAVATLGTATTREHAEVLFRNAADVYFCFDGDRAGRQAAWRAVESVLPRMTDGRQAWFVFLPDGEDPDSLVRSEGGDGLRARLAAATPLSTFFFAELAQDVELGSLDGKARLAERARPLLAQLPDGVFRDLMAAELKERTGSTRVPPPPTLAVPPRAGRRPPAPRRSLVRQAIGLLLQHPPLAQALEMPLRFAGLDQPGIGLLIELVELCRARPDANTAMLLEHFAGRDEGEALHRLALVEQPGQASIWREELLGAIRQLGLQAQDQRRAELQALYARGELDAAGKQELRELQARKNRLDHERVGT
jgi:DNA primase